MSVVEKKEKMGTKYYVHMAIILAFMFGFQFLPPFGPVTDMGMEVLGIFIGLIYGWTIGETIWPSIVALLLMSFVGENTIPSVLGAAYGNQTLLMVVFSLLFCYAVSTSGVLAIIARWLVSRKFAKKGPWMLAFAFFLASSVTGALVLNTLPVVLLLWEIFYDVCKQLGLKPYSKYVTMVMIGIVIAGYAGSMIAPYNGLCIICFGVLAAAAPDLTVNYGSYVAMVIAINIVLIPALTLFYKAIGPKDMEWGNVDLGDHKLEFNSTQKLVLLWIVALAAIMMLPNMMPKTWWITQMLNHLTAVGGLVLIPTLMMITTHKRERFLDINKGMMYGVTWNLYYLLATALYISSAVASKETGIAALLNQMMAPIMSGHGIFMTCAIMIALALIITNCINNVVTVTILTPIALGYMTAAGGNPVMLVALICFCCLQGVVMPAGSVCGALLHGNTKWLKPGMIYKYAIPGEIVVIIITCLVGIPVAMALF